MPPSSHSDHPTDLPPFQLGSWRVEPKTGRLSSGDDERVLEPQLMDLLTFLAATPGDVQSRDAIEQALWADTIVGEDTVARAVSRLRRALGDSARAPDYIETLPKRGYRLIATVTPETENSLPDAPLSAPFQKRRIYTLAGVMLLALIVVVVQPRLSTPTPPDPLTQDVARADDLYMRFTRADNEAAIGLYERVLSEAPEHADAQAGLANALVQRVIRYPKDASVSGADSLAEALDRGLTARSDSTAILQRAAAMAERAVRLAPNDPDAIKALAFVYTAQGDLERAETLYQEVLSLDQNAWAALINLGEISTIRQQPEEAVRYFERAWTSMSRAYEYEPQRVGPWQVALGVVIGELYEQLEQPVDAELWYRQVLAEAPYEPEATVRLAHLLAARGDTGDARSLCQALTERLGAFPQCAFTDTPPPVD